MNGLVVDLFAGGGGASLGLEAALDRPVDIAINHDPTAIAVHKANHPRTLHFASNIWNVDPVLATNGRPVLHLHASPDCTHFSRTKGGKPRSKNIRSLADVVVKWARAVRPACITLENVQEFEGWGPLDAEGHPLKDRAGEDFWRWRGELESLGYVVDHRVLDASQYGAPTKRKRLFVVARCDGRPVRWPTPTHGPGLKTVRSAAECIDWDLRVPSIFDRARPLAEKTLRRIAAGLDRYVVNHARPFVVRQGYAPSLVQTGYGERPGQAPRALDLHEPMGTIVAGGCKQGLVAAWLAKHYGGMVGVPFDGRPIDTITAKDHHALVTARCLEAGEDEEHERAHRVYRFLVEHGVQPRHVAVGRSGLVACALVGTRPVPLVDIGMRMLEPSELLRGQFGRFAATYDLSAAPTKVDQTRLIGNSVCPELEEALVRAQLPIGAPLARAA